MRTIAASLALIAVITLIAPAAVAARPSSGKAAALDAGDWRGAAELGASAADVVRALQARGQFTNMVPGESVVTIGPDNGVSVVALKPLPTLDPADTAGKHVRTAHLSGSGFFFAAAKQGSVILYPPFADIFVQSAPAGGFRQWAASSAH